MPVRPAAPAVHSASFVALRCALVVALLLVGGCTRPLHKPDFSAPATFALGDHWTTRALRTMEDGTNSSTYATRTVAAREPFATPEGTSDAWRVDSHQTEGLSRTDIHTWLRVTDLALLGSSTRQSDGLTVTYLNETFDRPCRQYQWPLTSGASWTVTCRSRLQTHWQAVPDAAAQAVNRTVHVVVESIGQETVPAGSFLAARLQVTTTTSDLGDPDTPGDERQSIQFYAPGACSDIRMTAPNDTSTTIELTDYACAAAA